MVPFAGLLGAFLRPSFVAHGQIIGKSLDWLSALAEVSTASMKRGWQCLLHLVQSTCRNFAPVHSPFAADTPFDAHEPTTVAHCVH